jgi:hypothetical protein
LLEAANVFVNTSPSPIDINIFPIASISPPIVTGVARVAGSAAIILY